MKYGLGALFNERPCCSQDATFETAQRWVVRQSTGVGMEGNGDAFSAFSDRQRISELHVALDISCFTTNISWVIIVALCAPSCTSDAVAYLQTYFEVVHRLHRKRIIKSLNRPNIGFHHRGLQRHEIIRHVYSPWSSMPNSTSSRP